jgi:GTP diphosphokinase / guanosine-3',5'-bis(diphosphate) 3'-diphosphatase
MQAHTEIAGSKEFIEGLREDFFSHRVFLFTPNGDVVDLPYGATPIDFAYAIHTDLGNHANGAKVNGKLVSFETPLHNGDVVEIVRRESAHPSEKWLHMAKTTLARKNIRQALGLSEVEKVPIPETKRERTKTPRQKNP